MFRILVGSLQSRSWDTGGQTVASQLPCAKQKPNAVLLQYCLATCCVYGCSTRWVGDMVGAIQTRKHILSVSGIHSLDCPVPRMVPAIVGWLASVPRCGRAQVFGGHSTASQGDRIVILTILTTELYLHALVP